jgi:large subunit ribosomal protein L30
MTDELKITLIKSTIGIIPKHKKIIEALGLRKLNSFVIQKNNSATNGMIAKVSYLLRVENI